MQGGDQLGSLAPNLLMGRSVLPMPMGPGSEKGEGGEVAEEGDEEVLLRSGLVRVRSLPQGASPVVVLAGCSV